MTKFEVLGAKVTDMAPIKSVQRAMYGEKYSEIESTFESCIRVFPEGSYLVKEAYGDNTVRGFIITERLAEPVSIPYIHNAEFHHTKGGAYLYVAGFGLMASDHLAYKLGRLLYDRILCLAKALGIRYCLVVCSSSEADKVEMQILRDCGFAFFDRVKWEILPERFSRHELWIWEPCD